MGGRKTTAGLSLAGFVGLVQLLLDLSPEMRNILIAVTVFLVLSLYALHLLYRATR